MQKTTVFILVFLVSILLLAEPLQMPSDRASLADGASFPGLPYVTGGKGQLKEVAFPDFPVNEGAIFVKFRLSSIIPGKSVLLFDACGTPAWKDRISLMLKMHENGIVEPYATITGPPSKTWNSRTISPKVQWDETKPHTIIYQWRNINSGKSDMEAVLWLDGVNVGALTGSQSNVNLHGRPFFIGGGKGSSGVSAEKDCLTIEDFRMWKGEIPAEELEKLNGTAVEMPVPEQPLIVLPKLANTPVIDGKIDNGFWTCAADFGPLFNYRKENVSKVDTVVKAAYDEQNLYLAWTAHFPDAMPHGSFIGARDGAVWRGDSMELFFNTDKGKVHYIISAYGDIFDELVKDMAWTGAAKFATSIGKGEWYGEMAIPLSEIKAPSTMTIDANVIRNVKANFSDSRSWVHKGFDKSGRLVLGEIPGLTMSGLTIKEAPIPGKNTGVISVLNSSTKQEQVDFYLNFTCKGKKQTNQLRRILPLKSGRNMEFEYQVPAEGINQFSLLVMDGKKRVLFFNHGEMEVLPPLRLSTKSYFYKGYMEANVDATNLAGSPSGGTVQIVKGTKTFGKEIPFELKEGKAVIRLETDKVLEEDGDYQVLAKIHSASGEIAHQICDFLFAKRPDCIDPKAGRKIYFGDGWFPPKRNGKKVEVWNRTYEWKDSIFPVSIISAGKELLKGTPYFEYVSNGKKCRLSAGKVVFVSQNEEMVQFDVSAEDAAMEFSARIHVEYDGFIGYDIRKLAPKAGANITAFSLNIPMDAAYAKYKLAGLETVHSKERDYIPAYPPEGRAFPQASLAGIGCFERGLFFAHESDQGWLPYGRKNVEQIIPGKDTVLWKWNVTENATLHPLPPVKWGLQVTPFKKFREDYLDNVQAMMIYPGGKLRPTDGFTDEKIIPGLKAQGVNLLVLFSNWSKHFGGMISEDMDSLKRLTAAAHKAGMRIVLYRCAICNDHEPSFVHFGDLWKSMPSSSFIGMSILPYEKRVATGRCPNSPDYVDWYVGSAKKLIEEADIDGYYYDMGEPGCSNALHGCGFQGLNETQEGEEASQTIGVNVDKLSAADKIRRSTWPVMVQRELWKRMYNMVHELKGDQGIIDAHTSDPARVLSMPFVDFHFHSESGAIRWSDDLSTLDLEGYRYYFAKEIFGGPGDLIVYARKAKDVRKAYRTWLAITLLHRQLFRPYTNKYGYADNTKTSRSAAIIPIWRLIKEFGTADAEWHPFYGDKPLAQVTSGGTDRTVVSGWKKNDKALLVISNLTKENRSLTLKISPSIASFATIINAESKSKIAPQDNETLSLEITAMDFLLLQLSKGPGGK